MERQTLRSRVAQDAVAAVGFAAVGGGIDPRVNWFTRGSNLDTSTPAVLVTAAIYAAVGVIVIHFLLRPQHRRRPFASLTRGALLGLMSGIISQGLAGIVCTFVIPFTNLRADRLGDALPLAVLILIWLPIMIFQGAWQAVAATGLVGAACGLISRRPTKHATAGFRTLD